MPPPTSTDPWLAARRFGVVIDAGSSGSRLQIYSWEDPGVVLAEKGDIVRNTLPKVEKGVKEGEDWITKAEPGPSESSLCLSSFADNPEGVASYLEPLIQHAQSRIPPSLEPETPLFLLATAGMRLLSPVQQARVLNAACQYLRSSSNFRIDGESKDGPCGLSVQIITGEEEGLFGWIAVNYLMDGFTGGKSEKTTYGFLDMGGASTQIAFEPADSDLRSDNEVLVDVRLRLLGGEEVKHRVFVTTWLGYGTNQARERYVTETIRHAEDPQPLDTGDPGYIPDPCLPKDLILSEGHRSVDSSVPYQLIGTGSFTQCLQKTAPLLNKEAPCAEEPCLFNGVHVPPINFSSSHFIGVSEYWYSSEHVFGLGGPYDFVQYERAATAFCGTDWDGIVQQHELSKQRGRLGGDGEVLQNGEVIQTGVWGDKVELSRLQMQCFKAAWVVNILHEGIGIPRIVDPGGNSSTWGEQVAQQARKKGLGQPMFQSVDNVGGVAVSWTLGKMVLEASKAVKPLSIHSRPLVDPVQDIPSTSQNPPIKPIRPPFFDLDMIEEKLSQHLPPALSRGSLGFSPVTFFLYIFAVLLLGCMTFRLRRLLRHTFRRVRRFSLKRDLDTVYSMEEGDLSPGASLRSSSRSVPSLFRSLRRFLSSSPTRPRLTSLNTTLRRSFSFPSATSPAYQHPTFGTSTASQYHSRSSSPTPTALMFDENGMMTTTLSNSISSISTCTPNIARSRNSSQMNLTTLSPRPMSLTRASSASHIPSEVFEDE
ncbi:nucleoside phosphatase family-domain-containing protein [Pisolithus marmoratus]|nr:nucleoside phosphatase family-domain-containing protein [Pisolithus marmoratus]